MTVYYVESIVITLCEMNYGMDWLLPITKRKKFSQTTLKKIMTNLKIKNAIRDYVFKRLCLSIGNCERIIRHKTVVVNTPERTYYNLLFLWR